MVEIRKASAVDSTDILLWRNDAETRAMSRNTGIVAADAHEKWFADGLTGEDRILFIGEADGEKIGMVRFDHRGGDDWEVNINLNPAVRGRKLSLPVLEQAIAEFAAMKRAGRLVASIRTSNIASKRIFARAGFRLVGQDGDFERHERSVGRPAGGD